MGEVTHIQKSKSEYRQACDDLAKMRMECYQAHIDAGFDHDQAMYFTMQDDDPGIEFILEGEE